MNTQNIILTGIPRSGTNLICCLLNALPEMVALPEPIRDQDADSFINTQTEGELLLVIHEMYRRTRESILINKTAFGRGVNGEITDNHFGQNLSPNGRRQLEATQGQLNIDKPLSDDFSLVFKQSGIFSVFLKELAANFPSYAVIRNPLRTLVSWSSIDFSLATGHHRHIEILNPSLKQALDKQANILDKQITLLSWFYEQYLAILPDEGIIRYEDVIATQGKCLTALTPLASQLNNKLEERDIQESCTQQVILDIGQRLLQSDGAFWHFYTRESVTDMLNNG